MPYWGNQEDLHAQTDHPVLGWFLFFGVCIGILGVIVWIAQ
jgi:hypothetical protein